MKKFLLDTDICIYLIKRRPVQVLNKLKSLRTSEVFVSSITVAELEYGVNKSAFLEKNKIALVKFLMPFEILSFDPQDAAIYGEIRADLERKGKKIGPMDMLIASQAVAKKMILVSNNLKEFRRVNGLKVENWCK